jgi:hypothetical protein
VAGPGQFTSDHHGFMTVELSARDFGFGFVDDKGAALYQAAIPLTV